MYSIEQRDEQLLGTTSAILYELNFDRAGQHLVRVNMHIETKGATEIVLVMPSWSPGSYKIRDYAGWQGNLITWSVTPTARNRAQHSWRDKASVIVQTNGAELVEVEYLIYAHERTVRTCHVNRFHAFLMLSAVCMYVEGRTEEIHHVVLNHDRHAWPQVSTALSPVQPPTLSRMVLGALNYDILVDSPIEMGDHQVHTFDAAGAKHEVAIATNHDVDVPWLIERIKRIVAVEAEIFGGVPYDRYVFIIQLYPGVRGGLEHARSSVNASDPAALLDHTKSLSFLTLLCHEFFHVWNVKRIRPVELGPFDYTREAYTPMLWLSEGLTSYYDNLIAYRCGFTLEKEYIKLVGKDHIAKLATIPGRLAMSTRDSSYLAWLKLYLQSPDGANRFPSYYLKGGVIAMLLDVYIVDHSDGKKSLDDAMRGLWKRYKDRPELGIAEDECIAIIERTTGVQIRERLMGWLNNSEELPYNEILNAAGLSVADTPKEPPTETIGDKILTAQKPLAPYLGWTINEAMGKLIVQTVDDGSPAAKAGIGIDDEIVSVGGKRVTSNSQLEHLLGGHTGASTEILAHCDGRMYSTVMSPVTMPNIQLHEIDNPTTRQQKIRKSWLNRRI